jgi:hypothetical protein
MATLKLYPICFFTLLLFCNHVYSFEYDIIDKQSQVIKKFCVRSNGHLVSVATKKKYCLVGDINDSELLIIINKIRAFTSNEILYMILRSNSKIVMWTGKQTSFWEGEGIYFELIKNRDDEWEIILQTTFII